ncbi:MAG: quinone oxidoreductase [Bryobacteraceae bacterium]|jgi:NADPH2:quinone reductase
MKAVFVTDPGGVDKLRYADLPMPKPGPGEALVKIHTAGVNFIDIYYRTGLYKAEPPVVLGLEGAGVVEQAGEGATGVAAGDRVAWAMARGSYAEYAVVPAWQLVKVPDDLSLEVAAGAMLQGMTAHYLTHSTYPLKSGDTALIHAAAGGAGQWTVAAAKLRGARVIGTVSTKEKAEIARQAGCDEVILYTEQDFEVEVKRLTGGKGVDVVYDSVGKATWEQSLNSLKPRGMMVSFGNASGPVDPIQPLILSQKGSLYLTRPTLFNYCATREELLWRANDVFGWLRDGHLKLQIYARYPLSEAGRAQEELASRKTTGKLLLIP